MLTVSNVRLTVRSKTHGLPLAPWHWTCYPWADYETRSAVVLDPALAGTARGERGREPLARSQRGAAALPRRLDPRHGSRDLEPASHVGRWKQPPPARRPWSQRRAAAGQRGVAHGRGSDRERGDDRPGPSGR